MAQQGEYAHLWSELKRLSFMTLQCRMQVIHFYHPHSVLRLSRSILVLFVIKTGGCVKPFVEVARRLYSVPDTALKQAIT